MNNKNRKLREADQQIRRLQELGALKPHFRRVGCDLPFYDEIDSYEAEFQYTVKAAQEQFPSLLGVHEVEPHEIDDIEWLKRFFPQYRIASFDLADEFDGYSEATSQGNTSNLIDDQDQVFSVVRILRIPHTIHVHPEHYYGIKLGTLHHELGHVHDVVNGIQTFPLKRIFPLVAGEVYANVYSLERLAERYCLITYDRVYRIMQEWTERKEPFEREIAQLVIEQHPKRRLMNWRDYLPQAEQRYSHGN